ncbi:MAG: hypothetical protein ACRD1H_10185, partial [Vicinamibacterales bacterium]
MPRIPVALAILIGLGGATRASGQGLPTEPLSLGDGRVVIGAEVTATFASEDLGFFNYTDYEYSALRNFRVGVTAEVRASERVQVLGEVRMDHGDIVQPFALYARIRPWPERRFDIQVGRNPPTFGAFGRGTYGTANMLIGTPLAYQYLTSLRPDALPAVPDDLIRMRGRGWLSNFPLGNTAPDRGLPVINSFRWDTGAQVHGVNGVVEWTGSLTTGSLSNPRVGDDNGGRQLAGRAVVRPVVALALGMSVSRGAFLSRSLEAVLADGSQVEDGVQQAVGIDAEYSEGRFLGRSEVIWSQWTLPMPAAGQHAQLGALAVLAEGRYRILPGVHVAARAERLGFSRMQTALGFQAWEAPV